MSLMAGESPDLMSGGRGSNNSDVQGGTLPDFSWGVLYHVTYPMTHLKLSPCQQTDAYENITFPQRYLRVAITSLKADFQIDSY